MLSAIYMRSTPTLSESELSPPATLKWSNYLPPPTAIAIARSAFAFVSSASASLFSASIQASAATRRCDTASASISGTFEIKPPNSIDKEGRKMNSTSTQFVPSRRMGIYEPIHQMAMWGDFKGNNCLDASPPLILEVDPKLDKQVSSSNLLLISINLLPGFSAFIYSLRILHMELMDLRIKYDQEASKPAEKVHISGVGRTLRWRDTASVSISASWFRFIWYHLCPLVLYWSGSTSKCYNIS